MGNNDLALREEYVSLRMGTDFSTDIINRYKEIVMKIRPCSLYKYKSIECWHEKKIEELREDRLIKSMLEDTMWISNPDIFNDPYDCLANTSFAYDLTMELNNIDIPRNKYRLKNNKRFLDSVYKLYLDSENMLVEICNIRRKELLVGCLSEINNSILMWSHYASNHKGFCLEYDCQEVIDIDQGHLLPVLYKEELFNIYLNRLEGEDKYIKAAVTKSDEWSYEKEWRIITVKDEAGSEKRGKSIKMPKPTAIYIGCKTPDDYKKILIDIAREKGMNVYTMRMRKDRFKLEWDKVDI